MFCDTYPMTPLPQAAQPGGLASLPACLPWAEAMAPRGDRRFALQDIADHQQGVQARELLFRLDSLYRLHDRSAALDRSSAALANALLEGLAAGQLPAGRLLIRLDEAGLRSPVADAVTGRIGVIMLGTPMPVTTTVLLRVAQLRAAGACFGIDNLTTADDARWLLAPYADFVRLDQVHTPPDVLEALVHRAMAEGLAVIGAGVRSEAQGQRMASYGVGLQQGPFIAEPREHVVPALPGLDEATLMRAMVLAGQGGPVEALAVAVTADPALLMRLQLLYPLYCGRPAREAASAEALLRDLPPAILGAWLEILHRTACHDHDLDWSVSVFEQVSAYRRAVLSSAGRSAKRASPDRLATDAAAEAAVWQFLCRLTSPAHYARAARLNATRLT